jgi:hypothetical protein
MPLFYFSVLFTFHIIFKKTFKAGAEKPTKVISALALNKDNI